MVLATILVSSNVLQRCWSILKSHISILWYFKPLFRSTVNNSISACRILAGSWAQHLPLGLAGPILSV